MQLFFRAAFGFIFLPSAFAQTQPVITGIETVSDFGAYIGAASPGSYISVYGSNLAGTTRPWAASDFTGNNAPTTLDDVSVTVGGKAAYLCYISPTLINLEVPDGVTAGNASVVVSYQNLSSAAASVTIKSIEPGLFAPASFNTGGTQFVAAVHTSSGAYVTTSAPAVPGEQLTFYGIGFGPVAQGAYAGLIASGPSPLAASFTMTIGGSPATVQYAGLAPDQVGVYQFNVVAPASLPTGNLGLQFALNGTAITLQTLALPVSGTTPPSTFTLTSSAAVDGGTLPATYTCDGTGSTLPLAWANPPAGTAEYALLLSTNPTPDSIKYDWVLYHIPAATTSLAEDSFLVGTTGLGDDGPGTIYDPPCSQGPGAKLYTFTLYALSAPPSFSVPAGQVTGELVSSAISSLTLGSAAITVSYSRDPTTAPGSSTNCLYVRNSLAAGTKSGFASASCDGTYAYISEIDVTTDPTMNGITSTNLQVPTPQNFQGANGWKIPLNPVVAPSPTPVSSGPIGVAVNGIPIFNPCVQQGNCTAANGDTKGEGQLDICNGHAGRADDYHYHAAPTCLMATQPANYWNTHPLGWALDGFAIFGYDNADGTVASRDNVCGGNTSAVQNAPSGYSYHVIDTFPYISNNNLCGVPSPDLANQGSKYDPMRQPPVTPFNVSNMTLTTDPTDGYQVLQFTSATTFDTTETGSDNYVNAPGTYQIRYKQVTGDALASLLAQKQNAGASACWNFQFVDSSGKTTQPSVSYCR